MSFTNYIANVVVLTNIKVDIYKCSISAAPLPQKRKTLTSGMGIAKLLQDQSPVFSGLQLAKFSELQGFRSS